MRLQTLVFLLFLGFGSLAQTSENEKLLQLYINEGDCERALLYFDDVYSNSPSGKQFYKEYLNCLSKAGDIKEAKKLIKTHYRKSSNKIDPAFDEGGVYYENQNYDKAEDIFQNIIEETPAQRNWVAKVANKFRNIGLEEWALKTYQYWSGKVEPKYGFYLESANIYGSLGKYDLMIDAYLDLVVENPAYKQSAQNAFLRYLNFDEDEESKELLRKRLLLYRQKNTENPAFSDLLIWYFTAIKEFRPAFTQLKGLVKRLGGGHQRILSLAIQAYKFEDYETAGEAVAFIQGANLTEQGFLGDVTGLDLLLQHIQCENACPSWLNPAKNFALSGTYSQFRMDLTRKVFDTYNKFVHADSAAHFLDQTISSPVYTDQEKGYFKLWKGDWWIENDDVWEAALLYGQVERRFKEDLLGGEAKFRSALISYYTGDFAWAQAQLKVLKASTSKLMANDALQLGVLISDNLGVDSIDVPLIRFAHADLKLKQNKRTEARETLNTILLDFPGHSLEDEIWFRFFTLDRSEGNTEGALQWLNKIRDLRSDDLFSDDAVFFLGEMEEELGNIGKARAFYLELLKDHPDSFFTEQARRKIRKLDSNDHL